MGGGGEGGGEKERKKKKAPLGICDLTCFHSDDGSFKSSLKIWELQIKSEIVDLHFFKVNIFLICFGLLLFFVFVLLLFCMCVGWGGGDTASSAVAAAANVDDDYL